MAAADAYFSLWFVAEGEDAAFYRNIIEREAEARGTPQFPPHITAYAPVPASQGEESIRARFREAARSMEPFTVEFEKATEHNKYFMCVFADCVKGDDLIEARRRAGAPFVEEGTDIVTEYWPHMSLIYGLSSVEERDAAVVAIDREVQSHKRIRITRLQLWDTTGGPSEWRMAADAPLGTNE